MFLELMRPQLLVPRVSARTAEDVLSFAADLLLSQGLVKTSFKRALVDRECSFPTGLEIDAGQGVAIPHTDPEHVIQSAISVITTEAPVSFFRMDDPSQSVSVRLVFILALSEGRLQVDLLQETVGLIQRPELRSSLIEAATPEDMARHLQGALHQI
ncbi:MAG: PTS sugar transporter subunit IIA [Kyrpidia sp.]|nr:PTS sugar transporter subunit IIA [Kyrpidia sp.]